MLRKINGRHLIYKRPVDRLTHQQFGHRLLEVNGQSWHTIVWVSWEQHSTPHLCAIFQLILDYGWRLLVGNSTWQNSIYTDLWQICARWELMYLIYAKVAHRHRIVTIIRFDITEAIPQFRTHCRSSRVGVRTHRANGSLGLEGHSFIIKGHSTFHSSLIDQASFW